MDRIFGETDPAFDPDHVNFDRFIEALDGDANLGRELMDLFVDECTRLRSELTTALAARDARAITALAHRLKGSIGVFVNGGPFDAAARLENDGRTGDLDAAAIDHDDLEHQLAALVRAVVARRREAA